jgi:hypothetical protein
MALIVAFLFVACVASGFGYLAGHSAGWDEGFDAGLEIND